MFAHYALWSLPVAGVAILVVALSAFVAGWHIIDI